MPRSGDAGPTWAVNGNQGNLYLFTADGFFIAELFRECPTRAIVVDATAERGTLLNDLTLHDENFWPSMTQTADGKITWWMALDRRSFASTASRTFAASLNQSFT